MTHMKAIRHTEKENKRKAFTLRSEVYHGQNAKYKKKAHEEMQRNPYTIKRDKP